MKWHIKRGREYVTVQGTARAHLYYWVRHNGKGNFTAGYYGFGRDIEYTSNGRPIRFSTVHAAKAYCKAKDNSAVIITAVTA